MNSENPYESPRAPSQPDRGNNGDWPLLPESRWHELDIQLENVQRGWFTRRISLAGSINVELYYNAAGNGETLYVDNCLLLTTSPFHWKLVAPRIDFTLPWQTQMVPARIDVTASVLRLMGISAFRLTIAGRLIYEE